MNFMDSDGSSLREQPRILQSSLACKDPNFGDVTVFGAQPKFGEYTVPKRNKFSGFLPTPKQSYFVVIKVMVIATMIFYKTK